MKPSDGTFDSVLLSEEGDVVAPAQLLVGRGNVRSVVPADNGDNAAVGYRTVDFTNGLANRQLECRA